MNPEPFASPNANPYAAPQQDERFAPAWDSTEDLEGFDAGPGTRLLARIVDSLLVIPLLVVGFLAWFAVFPLRNPSDNLGLFAVLVYSPILPLLIYQWYLMSTTGQSLGKRWLNIKIVKMDGGPVDFVSAVLVREWAPMLFGLIPLVGGLFPLIDALFIFGAESRCVHDHMAGTRVISTEGMFEV